MLKHYDHFEEWLEIDEIMQKGKVPFTHLASELMEQLGYRDAKDLNDALLRAFEVCTAMRINIKHNFRKIYRYENDTLVVDWHLSDLGSYLLMINGNPCNPNVAKAQMYLLLHTEAIKQNK